MMKRALIVLVVIALAAVGYVAWITIPTKPTPKDILAQAGYLELVPPSTFYGPGTLNTIEDLSGGSIQLHPTCEVTQAPMLGFIKVSDTLDQELRRRLSGSFDVTTSVEKIMASTAGAHVDTAHIESVTLRFDNSKILMMSDEALFNVQRQLLQGGCAEAVEINIRHGGRVCQSQSVFQADMVYEVTLKGSVELGQKAAIMRGISTALKLNLGQEGGNRLQGKRLFYGIKLSPNGLVFNTSDAEAVDCRAANL